MIIISIGENKFATLVKKANQAQKQAGLLEIRLDCLSSFTPTQIERLNKEFSPLFTLRSKKEGGVKDFSPSKRKELLKEVIELKPKYLDLEFKRDLSLISYLKKVSPKTKLILSFHDTQKMPAQIDKLILSMKKHRPWKVKIVATAKSTLDALKMLTYVKKHKGVIGIAMGDKGFLTRLLGPFCKEPITYAALSQKGQTAPGQFSARELEDLYNYSKLNSKTKLLAILGNPLSQSPGYRVYNQMFKKQKVNALYVNIELEKRELKKAISLMQELGFFGASVTIPFKEKVMPFIRSSPKKQKGIPSLNSLLFHKKEIVALNTDGIGALKLFKKRGVRNKKVLILGAGGTAKGIGFVLKQAGAQITISNRTDSKAKALARSLKGTFRPFETLKGLKKEDYDILVQATSVGNKDPKACILDSKVIYPGKTVLDVVFTETKLARIARKKNCTVFTGKVFWVSQAEEQIRFWFKKVKPNTSKLMNHYMP